MMTFYSKLFEVEILISTCPCAVQLKAVQGQVKRR
jgi:hypothetical protein